jgi:Villin headpiece domain/Gelsolin repeat
LDIFSVGSRADLEEGQETAEFWGLLGGQSDYPTTKEHRIVDSNFEPMLFSISNASGYLNMKQVPAFT